MATTSPKPKMMPFTYLLPGSLSIEREIVLNCTMYPTDITDRMKKTQEFDVGFA